MPAANVSPMSKTMRFTGTSWCWPGYRSMRSFTGFPAGGPRHEVDRKRVALSRALRRRPLLDGEHPGKLCTGASRLRAPGRLARSNAVLRPGRALYSWRPSLLASTAGATSSRRLPCRWQAAPLLGDHRHGERGIIRCRHPAPRSSRGGATGMRTMRLAVLLVLLAGVPAGAAAHPANAYWGQLETAWTWDPLVIGPLSLSVVLYVTGVARIWRHAGSGRGVRHWQVRSFALGWSLLVLALVAPLHWLGERLFAAHMIEHETLMILAAPLLVISRPFGAMMWGLPGRWRGPLGRLLATAPLSAIWRCLSDPGPATTLHAMALWAWHAPPLFNAALQYRPVHWLQHVS